jgi:hypothetical protein
MDISIWQGTYEGQDEVKAEYAQVDEAKRIREALEEREVAYKKNKNRSK